MPHVVFNRTYAKIANITKLPIAFQLDETYKARWIYLQIGKFFDGGTQINANCGIRVYKGGSYPANKWITGTDYTSPPDAPYALMDATGIQELPIVTDEVRYLIEIYGASPVNGSFELIAIPFNDI
jgi:hypothetical protein